MAESAVVGLPFAVTPIPSRSSPASTAPRRQHLLLIALIAADLRAQPSPAARRRTADFPCELTRIALSRLSRRRRAHRRGHHRSSGSDLPSSIIISFHKNIRGVAPFVPASSDVRDLERAVNKCDRRGPASASPRLWSHTSRPDAPAIVCATPFSIAACPRRHSPADVNCSASSLKSRPSAFQSSRFRAASCRSTTRRIAASSPRPERGLGNGWNDQRERQQRRGYSSHSLILVNPEFFVALRPSPATV